MFVILLCVVVYLMNYICVRVVWCVSVWLKLNIVCRLVCGVSVVCLILSVVVFLLLSGLVMSVCVVSVML